MKLLVLGATGMLGHKVLQRVAHDHEAWGTLRGELTSAPEIQGFDRSRLIGGVAASDLCSIRQAMERIGAEVVVNCIGIVKQIDAAKDPITSISINALLPHQIAALCAERGARLIHFSTDCVFSGHAGPYRESDSPDPADIYGRTKLLGEVDRPGCLTLRTSIVGREIQRGTGLLEWFIAQRGGQVRGFRQALYSGLTTGAVTDLLRLLIEEHADLSGVWQVSGDPIDKYSLLCLVNNVYGLGISIDPEDEFRCDRRLDSSRFRASVGWSPPSWQSMIETMHADPLL